MYNADTSVDLFYISPSDFIYIHTGENPPEIINPSISLITNPLF